MRLCLNSAKAKNLSSGSEILATIEDSIRLGIFKWFGFFVLTLSTVVCGEPKPNVILLMADDMGWAQTGYYGHPLMKTPNLDEMASNGLRLDRFYAAAPSCTPTRASVLTGRTNDRTGAFRVGHSINKQEKTIANAFSAAGYATAHFGKWHLNQGAADGHPLPADDPHNPGELGFQYWLSATSGFDLGQFNLSRSGVSETFNGDGSEVIVAEAIKFISTQVANNNSFFVVIWYSAPHGPWRATTSDTAPFLGKVDRTSANMLGEIIAIDRSIGHLRQSLSELGIAQNTLLWFTSDNGGTPNTDALVTGIGENQKIVYPSNCSDLIDPNLTSADAVKQHGCYRGVDPDSTGHLRGFKKDFYEGGLRSPTIVEWPKTIKPRVSNFPSSTVDIFPTLIEVASLDPESINKIHDGISLIEVFGKEPGRRIKPIGFRANGGWAWLDNDWKIVKNPDYAIQSDSSSLFELFNVIGDPTEERNLVDLYPGIANRMYKQYQAWSLSVTRSALGADYPEVKVLPTGRAPDPEVDKRLANQIKVWQEELRLSKKNKSIN